MLHFTAVAFPVLDVLRLVVLQSEGNEHFVKSDQFLEYACTQLGCQSHPKNQLVMLRVLCNMFKLPAGERFVTKHSEKLLSTALLELSNSAEKYIQVSRRTSLEVLSIYVFHKISHLPDITHVRYHTGCKTASLF